MMISPQLARLDEHLQRLRLNTVRERLDPPGLAPSGTTAVPLSPRELHRQLG